MAKYLKSDGLLHLPITDGVRLIRLEDVTDDDVKAIRKQTIVDEERGGDFSVVPENADALERDL